MRVGINQHIELVAFDIASTVQPALVVPFSSSGDRVLIVAAALRVSVARLIGREVARGGNGAELSTLLCNAGHPHMVLLLSGERPSPAYFHRAALVTAGPGGLVVVTLGSLDVNLSPLYGDLPEDARRHALLMAMAPERTTIAYDGFRTIVEYRGQPRWRRYFDRIPRAVAVGLGAALVVVGIVAAGWSAFRFASSRMNAPSSTSTPPPEPEIYEVFGARVTRLPDAAILLSGTHLSGGRLALDAPTVRAWREAELKARGLKLAQVGLNFALKADERGEGGVVEMEASETGMYPSTLRRSENDEDRSVAGALDFLAVSWPLCKPRASMEVASEVQDIVMDWVEGRPVADARRGWLLQVAVQCEVHRLCSNAGGAEKAIEIDGHVGGGTLAALESCALPGRAYEAGFVVQVRAMSGWRTGNLRFTPVVNQISLSPGDAEPGEEFIPPPASPRPGRNNQRNEGAGNAKPKSGKAEKPQGEDQQEGAETPPDPAPKGMVPEAGTPETPAGGATGGADGAR